MGYKHSQRRIYKHISYKHSRSFSMLSYFSSGQTHAVLLLSHCFSSCRIRIRNDAVWMLFLLWGMPEGKAEHYCHLQFWMRWRQKNCMKLCIWLLIFSHFNLCNKTIKYNYTLNWIFLNTLYYCIYSRGIQSHHK